MGATNYAGYGEHQIIEFQVLPEGASTPAPTTPPAIPTPTTPPAATTPVIPPSLPSPAAPIVRIVLPTPSTVYVDGKMTEFEAYHIGGNNFFKLRDLAFVLNGTAKQFALGYDSATKAISLTSGVPYTPDGSEMKPGDGSEKTAAPTESKVYLNRVELHLTAYSINGNNFFKLVDIMQALDVFVSYDDATKAITVDTNRNYAGASIIAPAVPVAPIPEEPAPTPTPTPAPVQTPPAEPVSVGAIESSTNSSTNGEITFELVITDEMSAYCTDLASVDTGVSISVTESRVSSISSEYLQSVKASQTGLFGRKTITESYPFNERNMSGKKCNFLFITYNENYEYVTHTILTVDVPAQ